MSNQTEREKLLPCPFCQQPLYQRAGINPYGVCRTDGCFGKRLPIVPLDVPAMVAEFNTRAAMDIAPDGQADEVRKAAAQIIANRSSGYKARNGRHVEIEGDDGERMWLVSFGDMNDMEIALAAPPPAVGGEIKP